MVREWGLIVKPQLKAVKGYQENAISIEKTFLKWIDALRQIT